MFETLYLKRPSKSSRSSKSSSESFRGVEDLPTNFVEKPQFNGNTFRKSKAVPLDHLKEEKLTKSPGTPDSTKSDSKIRKYLFGSFEKSKPSEKEAATNGSKDDRFKTITINSLRRSFRDSFLETSKPNKGREHQPLWFIDVKGEKEATPKPSSPKAAPRPSKIDEPDNLYENTKPVKTNGSLSRKETFRVDEKPKKYSNGSLERKETFRVDEKPAKYSGSSLGRRETFRVDTHLDEAPSPVAYAVERRRHGSTDRQKDEPVRVEIKSDRNGKVVPVAVTAPYSALNDVQERIRSAGRYRVANDSPRYHPQESSSPDRSPTRKKYSHLRTFEQNGSFRGDDDYSNKSSAPRTYSYGQSDEREASRPVNNYSTDYNESRDRSPVRTLFSKRDVEVESPYRTSNYKPVNRTVIAVRQRTDQPSPYRGPSPVQEPSYQPYAKHQNDSFARRPDTTRRSLKDPRDYSDESYSSKPALRIGSFRSAIERKPFEENHGTYTRSRNTPRAFKDLDDIDQKYSKYRNGDDHFNKNNWAQQSWRNISSRSFSAKEDVDPEYRSFVPYQKYEGDEPDHDEYSPKRENNNRTTININYDYNPTHSSPSSAVYLTNRRESPSRNHINPSPTRRNPSALTSMPSLKSGRDKSNKNRSVNFPSVEYEVRLISPNYESNPRRRVRSTNNGGGVGGSTVDWTFNKVHI